MQKSFSPSVRPAKCLILEIAMAAMTKLQSPTTYCAPCCTASELSYPQRPGRIYNQINARPWS